MANNLFDLTPQILVEKLSEDRDDAYLYAIDQLEKGASPKFQRLLAEMLDHSHKQWRLEFIGKPSKRDDSWHDAGMMMADLIDSDGLSQNQAVKVVKEKLGVGRTSALEALKAWREGEAVNSEIQSESRSE